MGTIYLTLSTPFGILNSSCSSITGYISQPFVTPDYVSREFKIPWTFIAEQPNSRIATTGIYIGMVGQGISWPTAMPIIILKRYYSNPSLGPFIYNRYINIIKKS